MEGNTEKTIIDLTDIGTLQGTDELPIAREGLEEDNKTTVEAIKDYVVASEEFAAKANKDEMSVTDGTGANADKTTIQLKDGTTATVLKSHQDVSGKAEKNEMSVNTQDGLTTIQLKTGTSAQVYTPGKVQMMLGLTVGVAVRCKFSFDAAGEYTLCDSDKLLMASIDGVGYLPEDGKITIAVMRAGDVEASFVFVEPTEIPKGAFADTLMVELHIPSTVLTIGAEAFKGCTELKNIYGEGITPPAYEDDSFEDVDMEGVTLTVHNAVWLYYVNYGGRNVPWGGVGAIEIFNGNNN